MNDPLRRLKDDNGDGTARKELMSKIIEAANEEMKSGILNM